MTDVKVTTLYTLFFIFRFRTIQLKKQTSLIRKNMKKPLKYSLITLLTGTYIFDRIGYPSSIVGSSMEPALEGVTKRDSYFSIKDIVWINRLKVDPQKSDIIAIIAPYSRKETLVKRVSALEGDRVMFPKINDGNNFIVPDHFFCVKSDNDKVGFDSRNFGPISKSMIIGKVTHIIWPPSRWRKL